MNCLRSIISLVALLKAVFDQNLACPSANGELEIVAATLNIQSFGSVSRTFTGFTLEPLATAGLSSHSARSLRGLALAATPRITNGGFVEADRGA